MPLEGIKSYRRSVVGYRNDFCITCNTPRRAHLVRSFKAYQLYYIPVLPLGFWRDWECSECGRDPHMYPSGRRNLKWLIVFLAGVFAITGVIASFDQQDSVLIAWLMRLGLPLLFFAVLWVVIRNKPDRALRQKLQQISPDRDDACALCQAALILDHGWRCSQCKTERMEIKL